MWTGQCASDIHTTFWCNQIMACHQKAWSMRTTLDLHNLYKEKLFRSAHLYLTLALNMKILEFSSVKNLGDLWCVIKGFFNCLKTGHCLFLRLVSHVCVTIYRNDQQSFLGVSRSPEEAGQFWQKEESFFLFFFCCFCALLQTNSCEKRPLWTSMYLSYHKKAEKTYFWVT